MTKDKVTIIIEVSIEDHRKLSSLKGTKQTWREFFKIDKLVKEVINE